MPPPSRDSHRSLPTPNSDGGDARGQKRKRVIAQREQTEEAEDGSEEKDFTKHYDPNQDPDERREVKRQSRALEREFAEKRDEYLHGDSSGLTAILHRANRTYKGVKQTNDATLDSRLMVNVSDLAHKRSAQLASGDSSTGVDVDEFLRKCIAFMRNGGPLSSQDDDAAPASTSRRRPGRGDDDEEDEDAGVPLDWEVFGRVACFPNNLRPPVPSFLLGPLSVEKKVRVQTQRRAKQVKDTAREARPESLTKEDMQQSDENGLQRVCTRIREQLIKYTNKAQAAVERAGFTEEDLKTARGKAMLKKCRLSSNGQVSLFDYVINPRSFGQSVENIFYISFLLKEGAVAIEYDDNALPTLIASKSIAELPEAERSKMRSKRHQAVFELDYALWQRLVDAYQIQQPMIPHRQDEQPVQVGATGWYA
ncbi:hypothetical protein EJ03DRAFT_281838 [Teratosphaeria nubilosa]|uniref:Non-structural maintenance of chromosomes element 4 n=1 Tax=Teratosphaeria nubilosa TaxID=161662 RepID=A0A6G1KV76_9PEZI|nr:hypothetical protein EJ03DRAFT_281838 [Teratosphaeria nubilosa]